MSRWVDLDACPCNMCRRINECGMDFNHPYCDRYQVWERGSDDVVSRKYHEKCLKQLERKIQELEQTHITQNANQIVHIDHVDRLE